jgi:hypothetical protein
MKPGLLKKAVTNMTEYFSIRFKKWYNLYSHIHFRMFHCIYKIVKGHMIFHQINITLNATRETYRLQKHPIENFRKVLTFFLNENFTKPKCFTCTTCWLPLV